MRRVFLFLISLLIFIPADANDFEKLEFSWNCNQLEEDFGSVPVETDYLLQTAFFDLNSNGIPDDVDAEYTYVSTKYSDRTKFYKNHTGIDFSVKQFIPFICEDAACTLDEKMGYGVFSPVSGTIAAKGFTNDRYGYRVIIYNDGYYYIFAHLLGTKMEELQPVSIGDQVHAGDIIGFLGGCEQQDWGFCPTEYNGVSSGPHLHFEIRKCLGDGAVVQDPQYQPMANDGTICKWED